MTRLALVPSIDQELNSLTVQPDRAFLKFRTWHVETNLNKAADLLDRCLIDRGHYNALRAQAAILNHTIRHDDELLVHEEARSASGYVDIAAAHARRKAEMLDGTVGNFAVIDPYLRSAHAATEGGTVASWQTGAEVHRNAIYRDQIHDDRAAATLQNSLMPGEVDRQKRAIVEARARLNDKRALIDGDGPLSYQKQAEVILERIRRDLDDATDRLIVASKGLEDIYLYQSPFTVDTSGDPAKPARLDAAVLWVRDAIRWVAAFSQLDQAFSVTIPLRKALGDKWDDVLTGTPGFFQIPEPLFGDHRYVRLRGTSAALALSSPGPGFCRCKLRVPIAGIYVHSDEVASDLFTLIDQGNMPSCNIGRVSDFRVPMYPEVAGGISLMNASPIGAANAFGTSGHWEIRLDLSSTLRARDVADLVLELRVTGRPR